MSLMRRSFYLSAEHFHGEFPKQCSDFIYLFFFIDAAKIKSSNKLLHREPLSINFLRTDRELGSLCTPKLRFNILNLNVHAKKRIGWVDRILTGFQTEDLKLGSRSKKTIQ